MCDLRKIKTIRILKTGEEIRTPSRTTIWLDDLDKKELKDGLYYLADFSQTHLYRKNNQWLHEDIDFKVINYEDPVIF